jgi:hypothetical protein
MPTGRVLVHEGGSARVIASGIFPTGIAVHPATGDVYIALLGNRILRAPVR